MALLEMSIKISLTDSKRCRRLYNHFQKTSVNILSKPSFFLIETLILIVIEAKLKKAKALGYES